MPPARNIRPRKRTCTSRLSVVQEDDVTATSDWPMRVGQATHDVIEQLAGDSAALADHVLSEEVLRLTGQVVRDRRLPRPRAAVARIAGMACLYLRQVRPLAPWVLADTELRLEGSRVDLVYRNSVTGEVFFDEIKSYQGWTFDSLSSADLAQARLHAEGGMAAHGRLFLGVRVLIVPSLHTAVLVQPDGRPEPLHGTRLHPSSLAETITLQEAL